jgi:hypothetical protein
MIRPVLYSFRFFSFCQICLELFQAEAAEVAVRGQAGLAGGEYAIADAIISFYRVGIGVDGDEGSLVQGITDPAPVHVEAAGMGIQLDGDLIFYTGIDDRFMIDGVAGPAEEESAGEVAQYGRIGVIDGVEQPHHGFFFGHLQVGVDGGDDEVECGKDIGE